MEQINLALFILQQVEKTPHKVFLRFGKQQYTYEQMYQRAGSTAAGFHQLGIGRGDKVAIMLDNCPEYLDVWFALTFLGAVAVPLNVHLRGEGLQYILSHSDSKAVVVQDIYHEKVAACLPVTERNMRIMIHGLEQLQHTGYTLSPDLSVPPEEINSILYTSGTTGLPKGAMLSHYAYVNSARVFADEMVGASSEDVLYTTLPLFHINAQAHTILPALYVNATAALGERFSASRFWEDIRFHSATIFNSLGSMIPMLCKQPERADDRENPARITACAATPKEFWQTFEERFAVTIIEGYGLTETAGFCVANPLHANRPPSIGKPLSFAEVKIAGEQGETAAIGEVGEMLIRPTEQHVFMEGYYKMTEKTEEAMQGGLFHTGDRGTQDEDGYLYFFDRIKQCIRRRGENISSFEIEKVVNDHPKVLESAAVGVPSEVGEEDVKLYVVLRQGELLAPEEVLDWCQERIAYFMVPRYVEFVNSFPKTATERIQKFKLKELGIGDAWDREKTGYKVNRR